MGACLTCLKQRWNFLKSNFLEIASFFISLGSFLLVIFIIFNFFNNSLNSTNENIAILTSAGIFSGIFASICYSQHSNRKREESLLKALSLLLFQFFRMSESYKDSYLWRQRLSFYKTSLERYSTTTSQNEVQEKMISDKTLDLDISNTIIKKIPTNEGMPFYQLGEFSLELFFTSINENLNGTSTTNLKASLLDVKSKIDLCNRNILESPIPTNTAPNKPISNNFGRLLNALIDLDKYIQKSLIELHKFKFINKFHDLKNTVGYNTLKIRHFK